MDEYRKGAATAWKGALDRKISARNVPWTPKRAANQSKGEQSDEPQEGK